MTSRVPIIVTILGATGTGKSKLAIELAQKYIGEIISADSMQVYKGLDVITAKVTKEEQAMAPHHMLDIVDPLSTFTVVDFRNRALPIIEKLLEENKMPIIVGGTNYYIESLLWQVLVEDPAIIEDGSNAGGNNSRSSLVFKRDDGYVKLFNNKKINVDDTVIKNNNLPCGGDGDPPFKKVKFDDPITNQELHNKLKEIDPESAARLHPNNRRKIMRSLQVFEQFGTKHSEILRDQRLAGRSGLGGPLRFANSVILWLRCDQKTLDERLNGRVDSMIESGLVEELLDFHERYNEQRLESNTLPDYTKGIFQSIGFKEFHEYLILAKEERKTDKGKKLLDDGIENLKLRTRRYARKQHKWVNNRFIKRSDRQVPPVYSLDTTDVGKWEENVSGLAISIINDKISGLIPNCKSLNNHNNNDVDDEDDNDDDDDDDDVVNKKNNERIDDELSRINSSFNVDNEQSNFCETCERVFVGKFQWKAHLDGRKHQRMVKRIKKKQEQQLQQQQQQPK